jgi:hypothetical protein
MSNEVAVYNEGAVIAETPNHLIALALDKGADPTTLSKLMDLQERWESGQARKAYVAAMTAFKQEAPAVLKKHDRVDFQSAKGRTAYNYANLGSIVQEITAILGKHELSASWGTEQKGPDVTVTCNITHVAGHRESVALTGPIDESGNKNRIQAVGSTVTYLQRYTLLAALGLATGEDDDGRQGVPKNQPLPVTPPQSKSAANSDPTVDALTVSGAFIVDVSEKSGDKGGRKWTLYGIHDGERWYNTFDTTLGKAAYIAKDSGDTVDITYKVNDKGKFDLINLIVRQGQGDVQPVEETIQEPFD